MEVANVFYFVLYCTLLCCAVLCCTVLSCTQMVSLHLHQTITRVGNNNNQTHSLSFYLCFLQSNWNRIGIVREGGRNKGIGEKIENNVAHILRNLKS